MKYPFAAVVLSSAFLVSASAHADLMPLPPQGVLNLQASARLEVPNDTLQVVFATTRDASDAAAVQSALKQALEAALNEARRIAKPGQVDVKAGAFSVHPRYNNKNQLIGWTGNAEMSVEGRDMAAIAQLTGRVPTMQIARVEYALSREAREKVEGEVASQAIARYKARAAQLARELGYSGYTIREISVATNEPQGAPFAMRTLSTPAQDEALPVEPGRGSVTATVRGSVQMK